MPNNDPDTKLEIRKADLGFAIVALGIVAVVAMFIVVILKVSLSSDVTTIATSCTAVIGTLVGAYFGIQKGSEGKDRAEKQRDRATDERNVYKGLGTRLIESHNQVKAYTGPAVPFESVAHEFDEYAKTHP